MMKKFFITALLVACLSSGAFAQKGSKQIGVGAEFTFSGFDSFGHIDRNGFGGSVKGLYGINNSGQATLTLGFLSYPQETNYGLHVGLLPVLAGYRQSFKSIYIEPQLGYTNYLMTSDNFVDNHAQLTWAAGVGYQLKGIDISVRYQSGHTNFKTSSFFAVRLGYNFTLSPGSSSK